MTPDALVNAAIKGQVLLERLKNGQVRNVGKAIATVEAQLISLIKELDVAKVGDLTVKRFNALLTDLRQAEEEHLTHTVDVLGNDMEDLADMEAEQEARSIGRLLGNDLTIPEANKLYKAVLANPISATGELLQPFVDSITPNQLKKTEAMMRRAYTEGWTVQQAVQALRGTAARGFKDGITALKTRQAEAVVRTSFQHVSNAARQQTWAQNADVIDGYQWLSTLDGKTTPRCQALDGQKFPLGKGPTPPIHINCRSTTVPDLNDGLDFLDKGATRSSLNGPVDAKTTYFDWLKQQPREFVVDTLGADRASMFLDQGLTPEQFRKLSIDKTFRPLTNKELRQKLEGSKLIEPGAPGAGTKTGALWIMAGEMKAQLGRPPTAGEFLVKTRAAGFNDATAKTQLAAWKKDLTAGGTAPKPTPLPMPTPGPKPTGALPYKPKEVTEDNSRDIYLQFLREQGLTREMLNRGKQTTAQNYLINAIEGGEEYDFDVTRRVLLDDKGRIVAAYNVRNSGFSGTANAAIHINDLGSVSPKGGSQSLLEIVKLAKERDRSVRLISLDANSDAFYRRWGFKEGGLYSGKRAFSLSRDSLDSAEADLHKYLTGQSVAPKPLPQPAPMPKPLPLPTPAPKPAPVPTGGRQGMPGKGATRRVWELGDELQAKLGRIPTRGEIISAGQKEGLNSATISTQYAKWKNAPTGGTTTKPVVAPKPAPAPAPKPAPVPAAGAIARKLTDAEKAVEWGKMKNRLDSLTVPLSSVHDFERALDEVDREVADWREFRDKWYKPAYGVFRSDTPADLLASYKRTMARWHEAKSNLTTAQRGGITDKALREVIMIPAKDQMPVKLRTYDQKNVPKGLVHYFNQMAARFQEYVHPRVMDRINVGARYADGIGVALKPKSSSVAGSFNHGSFTVNVMGNEHDDFSKASSTLIHEFTHSIEYVSPEVAAKTRAFLLKRANGDKLKPMYPGSDALVYEDEFEKRGNRSYAGRDYGKSHYATELLTVGIERLEKDPVGFMLRDREYFDLVIQALHGLL